MKIWQQEIGLHELIVIVSSIVGEQEELIPVIVDGMNDRTPGVRAIVVWRSSRPSVDGGVAVGIQVRKRSHFNEERVLTIRHGYWFELCDEMPPSRHLIAKCR